MHLTTISSMALLIAKAVDHCGLNSREIFEQAGLDPDRLSDSNARYSHEGMTRLWKLVSEITADPCIGLKVAHYWHPTSMHALGYSWMASATLKEALERLVRYFHVISTTTSLVLEEDEESVKLFFPIPSNIHPAVEAVDTALAVIIEMCRISYGDDFKPVHISMMREKPSCEEEFERFFRSPISYLSSMNVIRFSRADIELRLPTANAELARVNDSIVTDYLAKLDKNNIIAQVKSRILEQLPSGNFSEELIAQSLNKSLRSLQRKLTEEGTTYRALLDATRQELTKQYINNTSYAINEITYLTGFSEPSNFSRAFKRWTGQSPSNYRASLQ
ncbi:MAG: AraC family transcriptional regulator [Gammaproteobacteria bacterium]